MLRCVYEYAVYLCMSQTMCVEVRRQFVESILSYHLWSLGMELRTSGLAANMFTAEPSY